jgi:tetratricopeptide (TPR) repeat protein
MRQGTCSQCSVKGPLRTYFQHGGKVYCQACAESIPQPATIIDPTICAGCQADNGNSEFSLIGKLPFCAECQKRFYERPYPQWLKLGLAGLLMLLVVALVHGRKYFHAGREMYVGEKLVNQNRYGEAVPHLRQTVEIAPNSDKAVLLFAKASLLSGDPGSADAALSAHNGGRFEDTPQYQEVDRIFGRAANAMKETSQAIELAALSGKEQEAARLMHHAADSYPEMPRLAQMAQEFDEGDAFVHKDYDKFLAITAKLVEANPASPAYSAEMASALACKYAVTGDMSWRQKAEEALEKSRQLSQASPEATKGCEEYAERIRYRLDSREIIDKPEYDRRFRVGKAQAKN